MGSPQSKNLLQGDTYVFGTGGNFVYSFTNPFPPRPIPLLPQLPSFPSFPSLSAFPSFPSFPSFSSLPAFPSFRSFPTIPPPPAFTPPEIPPRPVFPPPQELHRLHPITTEYNRNKRKRFAKDDGDDEKTIYERIPKKSRRTGVNDWQTERPLLKTTIDNKYFKGSVTIDGRTSAAAYALKVHEERWRLLSNPQQLVFWVDGSGSGGAGIIYRGVNNEWVRHGVHIRTRTTSNEAEMVAICTAFKLAFDMFDGQPNCPNRSIVIFSDSQNALLRINSYPDWRQITPVHTKAMLFSQKIRNLDIPIRLHWVPKSAKIPGHVMADSVAYKAANPFPDKKTRETTQIVPWDSIAGLVHRDHTIQEVPHSPRWIELITFPDDGDKPRVELMEV